MTELVDTEIMTTREGCLEDIPFILSTWLNGLKFGNSWFNLIDKKIYFSVYHKVIEKILSKQGVIIKVACLKDAPDVILGYSVSEYNRLHWVYVKKAWRNVGVAKTLVSGDITSVSHLTNVGKAIFLKKSWIFDPFLLY